MNSTPITKEEFDKTPPLTPGELADMHKMVVKAFGKCIREKCETCGK